MYANFFSDQHICCSIWPRLKTRYFHVGFAGCLMALLSLCRVFDGDRMKMLDGGTKLRLSNITVEENGIYSCQAKNFAGDVDSSKNFLLNVRGKTRTEPSSETHTRLRFTKLHAIERGSPTMVQNRPKTSRATWTAPKTSFLMLEVRYIQNRQKLRGRRGQLQKLPS